MSTKSQNGFAEASQDLMDAWFQGMKKWQFTGTETAEHPPLDFVNDWMHKQQEFLSNIIGYDNPKEMQQQAPKHFQQWLDIQNDFAQQWMKKQEELMKSPFPKTQQAQFHQMAENWQESYQQWEKMMVHNLKQIQIHLEDKMPKEMIASLRSFGKTYTHLFEHWDSLQKLMKATEQTDQLLKTWMKNMRYTELIDTMMGFHSTDQLTQMMQGFHKNMTHYFHSVEALQKSPWDFGTQQFNEFKTSAQSHWQFMMDLSAKIQQQMHQTMTPFMQLEQQIHPIHMEKIVTSIQDEYSKFLNKSIDLQQTVYHTAENALSESIKVYQAQLKSDQHPSYQQFFSTWTNVVERHLLELFESEAYTAAQNELITLGSTIKKQFNEGIEEAGKDLPFVWRSEVNELIEEVQVLRKKVAALEKKRTTKTTK